MKVKLNEELIAGILMSLNFCLLNSITKKDKKLISLANKALSGIAKQIAEENFELYIEFRPKDITRIIDKVRNKVISNKDVLEAARMAIPVVELSIEEKVGILYFIAKTIELIEEYDTELEEAAGIFHNWVYIVAVTTLAELEALEEAEKEVSTEKN